MDDEEVCKQLLKVLDRNVTAWGNAPVMFCTARGAGSDGGHLLPARMPMKTISKPLPLK